MPKESSVDTRPRALFSLSRRLWGHLSKRRQHQFILLLGLIVTSAFAEVISLGAVLPFLGVLVSPDRVFQWPIVASIASVFGITSAGELVLPITFGFAFAALAAGGIKELALKPGQTLRGNLRIDKEVTAR